MNILEAKRILNINGYNLIDEARQAHPLVTDFWNYHKAKKAGEDYEIKPETIDFILSDEGPSNFGKFYKYAKSVADKLKSGNTEVIKQAEKYSNEEIAEINKAIKEEIESNINGDHELDFDGIETDENGNTKISLRVTVPDSGGWGCAIVYNLNYKLVYYTAGKRDKSYYLTSATSRYTPYGGGNQEYRSPSYTKEKEQPDNIKHFFETSGDKNIIIPMTTNKCPKTISIEYIYEEV